MLSFSLVAEALAGLIYHRPSGENFSLFFEVALTRFGSSISPYVPLGHNQTLPYVCSFVTYGHPEGSAADDITSLQRIEGQLKKRKHSFIRV